MSVMSVICQTKAKKLSPLYPAPTIDLHNFWSRLPISLPKVTFGISRPRAFILDIYWTVSSTLGASKTLRTVRQNKNCSIYTKDFSSCTKVIFLSKRIGISSNDDPATWCKIIITATIMIVSLWHCSNLIIIIIIIIITLITPALFHFFTEIIIIIKTVAVCTVQCRFGGKNDPFGTFFKLYLSKIQKKLKIFSLQISFIILYSGSN